MRTRRYVPDNWFICCFFFIDTATTEIYTLSLHDALPILGIIHWVVDLPTIDKYDDGGRLGNHHLYFERLAPYKKTITEFAFIPENIHDGQYFMKIEIPPMQLDAAPSRPFLFNFMEN